MTAPVSGCGSNGMYWRFLASFTLRPVAAIQLLSYIYTAHSSVDVCVRITVKIGQITIRYSAVVDKLICASVCVAPDAATYVVLQTAWD